MASQTTVHSHQSQYFEDLQMSSREFYLLLKNMIEEYRYPDVICTPVTLKEGGIFSSKRDYMRISRQRYHFFVCASPFGRSFFISWWLQEDANKVANAAAKVGMLGRVIAQRMESKTYYELDTEQMFTSSINAIIKMAIEKIKADRGYRSDLVLGS